MSTGRSRRPLAGHPRPLQAPARRAPRSPSRSPRRRRPRHRRSPRAPSPCAPAPGWYRGDLHCHTFHSDARGSPEMLHAAARQAGLDFLAVADHNTTTQRRYFHPSSSPDLVFVRAMEVTTATGHANVFGVDDWVDFRMTRPSDAHVLARHGARARRAAVDQPRQADDPLGLRAAANRLHGGLAVGLAGLELGLARAAGRSGSPRLPHRRHRRQRLPPARPAEPEGPLVLAARPPCSGSTNSRGRDPRRDEGGPRLRHREPRRPASRDHRRRRRDGRRPSRRPLTAEAEVRGRRRRHARLDRRHRHRSATAPIPTDDWRGRALEGAPARFLRAEIVAAASRARLLDDFRRAVMAPAAPRRPDRGRPRRAADPPRHLQPDLYRG